MHEVARGQVVPIRGRSPRASMFCQKEPEFLVATNPFNAGILLTRTLGTNFSEILGEIHSFSFEKRDMKMSSAKGRLFSLGLDESMSVQVSTRSYFI